MLWLKIFVYIFCAFGVCNVIAFGSGPFRIFERIRNWADSISNHFGQLFKCMMCLPANFGWIISLINWFLIPAVAFTPFNIILAGTNLWWLAALLDGGFTTGIVWLIYQFDEWLEREPMTYEDFEDDEEGPVEVSPKLGKKDKKKMLYD